jgi:hypothetical protein
MFVEHAIVRCVLCGTAAEAVPGVLGIVEASLVKAGTESFHQSSSRESGILKTKEWSRLWLNIVGEQQS